MRSGLKWLKEEQELLRKSIRLYDAFSGVDVIAGVDQAFVGDYVFSGIVVLDANLKVMEKVYGKMRIDFPYIAGYLSYREGPPIIKTFKKLANKPDLLMVDGNGILHPRKIGLASHVGLSLGLPTIGIAKGLLCGEVKNGKVFLENEQVGWVLKNKKYRPIYVSPGHLVSLQSAKEIASKFFGKWRLPEPLRLAHNYVNRVKQTEKESILKARRQLSS